MHNLRKHFCYFACSPNQMNWMDANETETDGVINGKPAPHRKHF